MKPFMSQILGKKIPIKNMGIYGRIYHLRGRNVTWFVYQIKETGQTLWEEFDVMWCDAMQGFQLKHVLDTFDK